MAKPTLSKTEISLLKTILECAESKKIRIALVGGVIRDTLLDIPSLDFDFIIEGEGLLFARELQKKISGELKEFPNFLTAKITGFNGAASDSIEEIDIASARKETYLKPGALPEVESTTIENDLARRDFTINTLTIDLKSFIESAQNGVDIRTQINDPFKGLEDLENKLVRILHPKSFIDDPTRIFRACRYASRISGDLEPQTEHFAKEAVKGGALSTISRVRIGNELSYILAVASVRPLLKLNSLGVFGALGFDSDCSPKIKLWQDASSKVNKREYTEYNMLLPLFLRLLTEHKSQKEREDLFVEWNLGKKILHKVDQFFESKILNRS